jgi:hypothetical protein
MKEDLMCGFDEDLLRLCSWDYDGS